MVTEHPANILSVTRIVQARGGYPATYRVMYERSTVGGPYYMHVHGTDELNAYRKAKDALNNQAFCEALNYR